MPSPSKSQQRRSKRFDKPLQPQPVASRNVDHSVTMFGRRVTPWRSTRDEAVADAEANGHAEREPWPGGKLYLNVGVEIISRPRHAA
jgi:hypothetical protein